jgi:enolase-phosphatase E1
MTIRAIVTDIEGTTSSIDFVHRILFPYSAKALPEYLRQYAEKPEIAEIIEQVRQEMNQPKASIDCVIAQLLDWIKEDKKITPLKTLQGFLWEHGFKNRDFKGHLYEDAFNKLKDWHELGIKLYVFSSGSKKAQKLLFGHSEFGDLTYLFSGYFDTHIGNKKQVDSYRNIAQKIEIEPQEILFLSDVVSELDAASEAGYQTLLLARNQLTEDSHQHKVITSFNEISLS